MGRQLLTGVVAIASTMAAMLMPGSASAGELKVGHDFWIGYAGVFVAEAKGFFKDEGVDVELRSFAGPGDSLPPLIAGHLDMTLTTLHNLGLVAGMADGPPLELVFLIDASNGADAIVAKKAITSVAGLKGKKIAVTLNEANHLFLVVALENAGLTEKDVQLVNVSADDAGAAFLAGSVDAAVTWEPWVSRAKSGGDGHIIFSTKDAPDLIINAIVAPQTTRDTKKADVAAFIRAVDKGVQFLREHPDEAKAIIAKKLESTPEDVAGMLDGDKIYDLAANAKLLRATGEGSTAATMGEILTFLSERDLIKKPVEPTKLIDTAFVPE